MEVEGSDRPLGALPPTYDMWILSKAGHLQHNRQKDYELSHIRVRRSIEK